MTRGAAPAARATVIDELHALLKADLAGQTPLRHEPVRAVHWRVARLASAVAATAGDVSVQPASPRCTDLRAVARFRAETRRFAEADNRAGGGLDRDALIRHLTANIRRLSRGVRSEQTGRALFSALAEAILLLAWMTFDVAPESALTQKYFTYARLLAHRAGHRVLEAAVLAAMSQQARYAGVADEAGELAAAARQGTLDGDPPCIRFFDESAPAPWKPVLKTVCGYAS
ncbi:MAG TPA: hypothetical protein VHF26_03960 [Trebonia sp.]|nr:hypothetical protein [Trebonia sp.]